MEEKSRSRRKVVLLAVSCFILLVFVIGQKAALPLDDQSSFSSDTAETVKIPVASLTENLSSQTEVTGNAVYDDNFKFAIDEKNNIYFVWTEGATQHVVYYRVFYYANQSWSAVMNLTAINNPNGYSDFEPDIQTYGEECYIVWTRDYGVGLDGRFKTNFVAVKGETLIAYQAVTYTYTYAKSDLHPILVISPQGDVGILTRYKATETSTESSIRLLLHKSSDDWAVWQGESNLLDELIIITTSNSSQYAGSIINDIKAQWTSDNTLHVAFEGVVGTDHSIYYGKNSSDLTFGQYDQYSLFTNLTSTLNSGINPTNLVMEKNEDNGYLYIAWDSGDLLNRSVEVFNKTFSAASFNVDACFSIILMNAISPYLAVDNDGNVLVVWKNSDTSNLYYVRNITVTEADIGTSDIFASSAAYPRIRVSPNNDIYMNYVLSTGELEYKQYDRNGPHLVVETPSDGSAFSTTLPFSVIVEPDTVSLTYEYWNDTNENNLTDDGGSWVLIASLTSNFNYSWPLNQSDARSLIIRVNATDKNYLNETVYVYDVAIDNNPPNIVNITRVYDNYGHDSSLASFANFCKGNITFEYDVQDFVSGIHYIELWNGTTKLAETTNTTALTWVTNGSLDGNYTALWINAYDYAGLNNSDSLDFWIYIDNTPPNVTIASLEEGVEYSGTLQLIALSDNDTAKIYVYITGMDYDYALLWNPHDIYNPGLMEYVSGTWRLTWNTADYDDGTGFTGPLNGEFTVSFEAIDIYNNTRIVNISIILDNKAPTPQFISPQDGSKIGFIVNFNITTDNDTVSAQLGYGEGIKADFYDGLDYTDELNITNEGDVSRIVFSLDLGGFEGGPFTFSIKCVDNQGLIGYRTIYVELEDSVPKQPYFSPTSQNLPFVKYNATTQNYDVHFVFHISTSEGVNRYLIYRSLTDFDVASINAMDSLDRLSYLGEHPGEGYCVGEIIITDEPLAASTGRPSSASENQTLVISPDDVSTYLDFVDYDISPNVYYYAVIAINEYGNPSLLSNSTEIKVPIRTPDKQINLSDLKAMPYVFLVVISIVAIISATIIKSAKKIRTKREIKKVYEEILDQEYDVDKKEKKTLEDRLDEIEQAIGIDTGERRATQDIDLDEFLSMTVEEEKEESIIGDAGLKKCPTCGWTLSSNAKKCPRCGREFL